MKDIAKADSIMQIVETVYNEREDSAFMVFARKNPSSYIALNHIYNKRGMDKYPFERYSKMAEALTLDKFKGKQWRTFHEMYEKDEALEPGHPMPAFAMNDRNGTIVGRNLFGKDLEREINKLFAVDK